MGGPDKLAVGLSRAARELQGVQIDSCKVC